MTGTTRAENDQLVPGQLTGRILGCAIDSHRVLGPGMLESTYRKCLVHRLRAEGMAVKEEEPVSIEFRGLVVESAYRADLIVEDSVLLELKSVDALLPIHDAQVLTYLKFLKLRVGLLLNFNLMSLSKGMRRFVR
jgi:GxxExxY protein